MPIYCANGTRSASCKRSKNMTNDLLAPNNLYANGSNGVSNGGRKSNAKQQHQTSSLVSHSLIMTIGRLRHSVQNMRETVLIPTRLSDLAQTPPPPPPAPSNTTSLSGDTGEPIDSSDCSSIDCLSTSSASSLFGESQLSLTGFNFVSLAMSRHNLYEQYKLLDLIDKIVSSDTVLPYGATLLSSVGSYASKCGKSHHKRHYSSPIYPFFSARLASPMNNGVLDEDNNNATAKHTNGNAKQLLSIDYNRARLTACPSPCLSEGKPANLGDDDNNGSATATHSIDVVCCANNGSLLSECSLLKVKEKLEYHLTSLKTILNLMANNAEYITQKYLEDIQCDDRFKLDTESNATDELASTSALHGHRHYYTSNLATL